MKRYSEKQIKLLHRKFQAAKKYSDKLSLYDRHFGIIPFEFPDFDPALRVFFDPAQTDLLTGIFKMERNNPALNEKRFYFSREYRFSIRPANSNRSIYSNYILSRFLSRMPQPARLLPDMENEADHGLRGRELVQANGILNQIEFMLLHEYDKSPKLHFMTVFYKGLHDVFTSGVVLPDKKRKFIELYLYALGIGFGRYMMALRKPAQLFPGNLQQLRSGGGPEPVYIN